MGYFDNWEMYNQGPSPPPPETPTSKAIGVVVGWVVAVAAVVFGGLMFNEWRNRENETSYRHDHGKLNMECWVAFLDAKKATRSQEAALMRMIDESAKYLQRHPSEPQNTYGFENEDAETCPTWGVTEQLRWWANL